MSEENDTEMLRKAIDDINANSLNIIGPNSQGMFSDPLTIFLVFVTMSCLIANFVLTIQNQAHLDIALMKMQHKVIVCGLVACLFAVMRIKRLRNKQYKTEPNDASNSPQLNQIVDPPQRNNVITFPRNKL